MNQKRKRGYFGIAVWHPKTGVNIGTLWRSAAIVDAAFLATIGCRYPAQASDTIKAPRHTPLWHFDTPEDFWAHIPHDCRPVAVEIDARAKPLPTFVHPERAVYILGPEDGSLPDIFVKRSYAVVQIPGAYCYNLAVAGSIVLYDRIAKIARKLEG
jgi:tRNA(Leu) C34 or U34 (ribose-2'-O)-methylase TrmL